ncbi:MAG: DUF1643 domain-containing protein [Bacteroidetes bacterium]|nr:DUF1643 domain-containing protein [Bacteroidota bacterium]
MKKPVYKHPDFVIKTDDKRIEKENKRLWLSLQIDSDLKDSLVVILKNPSRATKDISDKTVYTVTSYVHNNRNKYSQFKNIGNVIILNLIPYYQTYAELLATSNLNIIDKENEQTIIELTSMHKNVIIAWGDHPKGLYKEYEELKRTTFDSLKVNKNQVYYVDKLSKNGNPKHGQVWGYDNELKEYKL